MNWTNYDRLIGHMHKMLASNPLGFDYMQGFSALEPGCVDCQCAFLMGEHRTRGDKGEMIRVFLGVTPDEAHALWKPSLTRRHWIAGGEDRWEHVGEPGIREALRRLAVVGARYQRPVESAVFESKSADGEAAFLAECQRIARAVVNGEVTISLP